MLTMVSFLLSEDTHLFEKVDNSLFIVYTAIFVSIGYTASVSAMRYGDVTFVSPFRYTALIWASVMGFIFLVRYLNLVHFLRISYNSCWNLYFLQIKRQ